MNPQQTTWMRVNSMSYGLQPGVLGATADRWQLLLQGCSHLKCPGCTSLHTHDPSGGRRVSTEQVLAWIQAMPHVGGLTISGGEPSDQAVSLVTLLQGFRIAHPNAEVVLYSALLWPRLQRQHAALISLCDVVVAGPYVASLPPTPLAGSSNQTVHLLTPLAKQLYAGWRSWPLHRVQLGNTASADKVVMVGIPSRAMTSNQTIPTLTSTGSAP